MSLALKYLVVVQGSGLPLYAQSFGFYSDEECQTFSHRLTKKNELEKNQRVNLLGSYFQVMKELTNEVVDDKLNLIDLRFETYQITGRLQEENLLFLGIVEKTDRKDVTTKFRTALEIVEKIASVFIEKYSKEILNKVPVDLADFEDFSEEIIKIGIPIHLSRCRNCLRKCVDENKGCLPHLIYFNSQKSFVETSNEVP